MRLSMFGLIFIVQSASCLPPVATAIKERLLTETQNAAFSPAGAEKTLATLGLCSTGMMHSEIINALQHESLNKLMKQMSWAAHPENVQRYNIGSDIKELLLVLIKDSLGTAHSFPQSLGEQLSLCKATIGIYDPSQSTPELVAQVHNQTISQQTNGIINDVITQDMLSQFPFALFYNLYIRVALQAGFNPLETVYKDFIASNGRVVKVPFMVKKVSANEIEHFSDGMIIALRLRMHGNLSLFLARNNTTPAGHLSKRQWERVLRATKIGQQKTKVLLHIPKHKVHVRTNLDFLGAALKLTQLQNFDVRNLEEILGEIDRESGQALFAQQAIKFQWNEVGTLPSQQSFRVVQESILPNASFSRTVLIFDFNQPFEYILVNDAVVEETASFFNAFLIMGYCACPDYEDECFEDIYPTYNQIEEAFQSDNGFYKVISLYGGIEMMTSAKVHDMFQKLSLLPRCYRIDNYEVGGLIRIHLSLYQKEKAEGENMEYFDYPINFAPNLTKDSIAKLYKMTDRYNLSKLTIKDPREKPFLPVLPPSPIAFPDKERVHSVFEGPGGLEKVLGLYGGLDRMSGMSTTDMLKKLFAPRLPHVVKSENDLRILECLHTFLKENEFGLSKLNTYPIKIKAQFAETRRDRIAKLNLFLFVMQ